MVWAHDNESWRRASIPASCSFSSLHVTSLCILRRLADNNTVAVLVLVNKFDLKQKQDINMALMPDSGARWDRESHAASERARLWQLLWQMKRKLALADCQRQFVSHNVNAGVVGQFQVVDTGHDGRQKVVGVLTDVDQSTDDCQRRNKASQTYHIHST